jgi:hypothetical protein
MAIAAASAPARIAGGDRLDRSPSTIFRRAWLMVVGSRGLIRRSRILMIRATPA